MRKWRMAVIPATILVAAGLTGCDWRYVKRDEFNTAIAQLRGEDVRLRADLASLKQALQARFEDYDVQISQLKGRVRVDLTAQFEYRKAEIREQDKPVLQDFARVVRDHHPDVLITVEGFTDPAGSPAFNKRLGLKRAQAVREFLIAEGLNPQQIRAVSYGESKERQVVPGATGDEGLPNRRVALVIDSAGQRS